ALDHFRSLIAAEARTRRPLIIPRAVTPSPKELGGTSLRGRIEVLLGIRFPGIHQPVDDQPRTKDRFLALPLVEIDAPQGIATKLVCHSMHIAQTLRERARRRLVISVRVSE